jgi:hypothetical protein
MESDVFRAGVRPGSPGTADEIKLLLCYILSGVAGDMSFAQLNDALTEQELVNYFDLIAAVDSLLATGHIEAVNEAGHGDAYRITELGRATSEAIDTLLPKAVRDKASLAAKRAQKREKRRREVFAEVTGLDKGYEVALGLPYNGSMFSAKVFCPTVEEANLVRRRFLNDPAYIYKGLMALLTGDSEVLGKVFPSGDDELF